MDAKFIRGMLNEPDLQPNAAMNRWIQGILLFDFNLVHVPASHFARPDALSRRLPASQEEYVSDDETWMDNTFLLSLIPNREEFKDFCFTTPTVLPYDANNIPSVKYNHSKAEQIILQIQKFLTTLELPPTESLQARKRFLKKAAEFYLKDEKMFKRNGTQLPLLVIHNAKKKLAILTQAHECQGTLAAYLPVTGQGRLNGCGSAKAGWVSSAVPERRHTVSDIYTTDHNRLPSVDCDAFGLTANVSGIKVWVILLQ
jgi:hypothetical protein